MSDCQRKVSPPKLLLISKHPTGKEVDKKDKMLTDEIQELVNTDKIKKIMYYEKTTITCMFHGSHERIFE